MKISVKLKPYRKERDDGSGYQSVYLVPGQWTVLMVNSTGPSGLCGLSTNAHEPTIA